MLFQSEKEHSSALLELILKRNKKEVVTPFVSHYRCTFHAHLKYGKGAGCTHYCKEGFQPISMDTKRCKSEIFYC